MVSSLSRSRPAPQRERGSSGGSSARNPARFCPFSPVLPHSRSPAGRISRARSAPARPRCGTALSRAFTLFRCLFTHIARDHVSAAKTLHYVVDIVKVVSLFSYWRCRDCLESRWRSQHGAHPELCSTEQTWNRPLLRRFPHTPRAQGRSVHPVPLLSHSAGFPGGF